MENPTDTINTATAQGLTTPSGWTERQYYGYRRTERTLGDYSSLLQCLTRTSSDEDAFRKIFEWEFFVRTNKDAPEIENPELEWEKHPDDYLIPSSVEMSHDVKPKA